MDSKELKGLMEAYAEMYAPEQLDELSDRKLRAYIKKSDKSHKAINKKWDQGTATEKEKLKSIGHEIGQERAFKRLNKEGLDIFDIVLEFLQVEGYAETLEEAEWIMANELDAEDIDAILEAEGSYGQTPKARQAMGKLAISRREKPASEYSQKGEKTKKVKEIEKHTRRIDNGPNVGNRGKRSTPPRYSAGRGKMDADAREYSRSDSVEYGGGGTHGPGSVTKNPKKLRKQKAIGEID